MTEPRYLDRGLAIAEAVLHQRRVALASEDYIGVRLDREELELALQALALIRRVIADEPEPAQALFFGGP